MSVTLDDIRKQVENGFCGVSTEELDALINELQELLEKQAPDIKNVRRIILLIPFMGTNHESQD